MPIRLQTKKKAEICNFRYATSQMYSDSIYKNKYGMIFISILTDANLGVYRNKNNGAVFASVSIFIRLPTRLCGKSILIKKFIPQIVILKKRICRRLRKNMNFGQTYTKADGGKSAVYL